MMQRFPVYASSMIMLMVGCLPAALVAAPTDPAPSNDLSLTIAPDILGPNGDSVRIDIAYGWYIKPNNVLRFKLFHNVIEDIAPDENDYKSQAISISYEKQFTLSGRWSPYVGVSLAYRKTLFNDVTETAASYGPYFGVHYLLTDTVALDIGLDYQISNKKVFLVDFEAEDTYLYPTIGFRVFLN